MTKVNTFIVEQDEHKIQVIIPDTGDVQENAYLEEAEREKTLNQLKARPPREVSKVSHKDKVGALREWRDYQKRKKESPNRKYF